MEVEPAARFPKDRLAQYLNYLSSRFSVGGVGFQLHLISRMVFCMTGVRLTDVTRVANRAAAAAHAGRNIDGRLVSSGDLVRLGLNLMSGIDVSAANRTDLVTYRDGLMIAMLAARPIRRAELLALRIGENISRTGGVYSVYLNKERRKTKRPIDFSYPAYLSEFIDSYVESVLPRLRVSKTPTLLTRNAFWVSREGSPLSQGVVSCRLSALTKRYLGRDVSPHLFRHCVGTSIAILAPMDVGIIRDVLGHTSHRTGEKYYNLAKQASAMRRLQSVVLGDREDESD